MNDAIQLTYDPRMSIELVDATADIDSEGRILGLEVIGYAAVWPKIHLPTRVNPQSESLPTLSVDPDANALYLRIASGRVDTQRRAILAIAVDDAGEIRCAAAKLGR